MFAQANKLSLAVTREQLNAEEVHWRFTSGMKASTIFHWDIGDTNGSPFKAVFRAENRSLSMRTLRT